MGVGEDKSRRMQLMRRPSLQYTVMTRLLAGKATTMAVKKALRSAYHFVRGTHRPKITPIGAYPLVDATFAFRFETSATRAMVDDGAHLRVVRGGVDVTGQCIELRRLAYVRGGIELVKASYSLALAHGFGQAKISLAGKDGKPLAIYTLSERGVRRLLDDFSRMTCDAGNDKRYDARDFYAHDDPAPLGITPIDVIIACDRADGQALLDTIESLDAQGHRVWRALLAANEEARAQADAVAALLESPRIIVAGGPGASLGEALACAISLGDGAALFLRQGDMLAPHALAHFASALDGRCDLSYCDVDFSDGPGTGSANPQFKPAFNLDMLYSQNYIDDAFALNRATLDRIGANPVAVDGAWSYELVLRAAETPLEVEHIAHIGCHVRTCTRPDAASEWETRALEAHFARRGIDAHITDTGVPGVHRTTFSLAGEKPAISIIIPNKDHVDYLKPCIDSIVRKAGYDNFEIVVVENNSTDGATFSYYERIARQDGRVRIVDFTHSGLNDGSFNYPRLVNFGVRASTGSLLLLLNNDTQVITDGFLPLLAGYFTRPEVGVAGALLRHADGLVQHAGMALLRSGRAGFMNQHLSPNIHGGYLNSLVSAADCSCVLGACQMVRRETFDAVGGYCEELAITGNDIDFCWKVRERGMLVVYTPHVELYHKEFGSRRSDDADTAQEEQSAREAMLVAKRWPRYFSEGDGFINPNLDQESIYYKLRPGF